MVTNNGSAFVNLKEKKPTVVQQVCSELRIVHMRIASAHPQSIGLVERFHGTLREEEISLYRYSNPEEARQRIRIALIDTALRDIHQGIGDVKATDIKVGRTKSYLEGRNFSKALRETARNQKS